MSWNTVTRSNTPQLTPPLKLEPAFDPKLDPLSPGAFKLDEAKWSFQRKPLTLCPETDGCKLILDPEVVAMARSLRLMQSAR